MGGAVSLLRYGPGSFPGMAAARDRGEGIGGPVVVSSVREKRRCYPIPSRAAGPVFRGSL